MEKRKTSTELMDFYKSILASLNCVVSDEGLVSVVTGETKQPVTVGGRRLILPTHEVLRQSNWDDYIAFHPMSEQVYNGESPVIRKVRDLILYRLNSTLVELIMTLAGVAADPELESRLTPAQTKFLVLVKDIVTKNGPDKKVVENIKKILMKVASKDGERVASLYMRKTNKFKGENVAKATIVTFPINKGINSEDHKVFGVKCRTRDLKVLDGIMEYLVPNYSEEDFYSSGTNSSVAPYLVSLLEAFGNVAAAINKRIATFRKYIPNDKELEFDLSYLDDLAQIAKFEGVVPVLEGNEGEPGVAEKQANQGTEVQVSATPTAAPTVTAPQPTPPVPSPPTSSASDTIFDKPAYGQVPAYGTPPPPPMNTAPPPQGNALGNWANQAPTYQQPQYGVPQQPTAYGAPPPPVYGNPNPSGLAFY